MCGPAQPQLQPIPQIKTANPGNIIQTNLNTVNPSFNPMNTNYTVKTPVQTEAVITTSGPGGLNNLDNIVNRATQTPSSNPQAVSLQQFITQNPGAAGLAEVLKSKGMSDAEIVALLQKGKDEWLGGTGTPSLPTGAATSSLGAMGAADVNADIYAFMALFQKMAQDMKATARLDREQALTAQATALQSAADQMKAAAEERLQAAIIQGATQIGGGVMQMGAAGLAATKLSNAKLQQDMGALQQSGAATNLTTKTTDLTNKITAIQQEQQKVLDSGQKFQSLADKALGSGQIASGAGQIKAAGSETLKAELDANAQKLDAQIKLQQQAVEQANDMMQQMQDIIRDIRDKLQAIQQSAIETNRGIARNI